MLSVGKYFWCPSGQFLDMTTFTCNADCPVGFIRYPDSLENQSYCGYVCSSSTTNFSTCPNTNALMKYATLPLNLTCNTNLSSLYYKCFPTALIPDSK